MFFRTESFQQFIRYYPVVTTLLAIHIILFLLMALPGFFGAFVFESVVGVNLYISNGEIWRLFTPIFAHKQFSHLLFNSFALFLFGPPLEQRLGIQKFLFIYLAAGIVANIATFFLMSPTYVHLGASGAIFGLFGYYVAIILLQKERISHDDRQTIITITVLGLVMTFLQANINATAHIVGLLAGFIIGAVLNRSGKRLY